MLTSAISIKAQEAYAVLSEDLKTLTFYYDNEKDSREGMPYTLNYNSYTNTPKWYDKYGRSMEYIEYVIFDNSFSKTKPTSTYEWFLDMTRLKEIQGLQYLNTSEVKRMDKMFRNCHSLTNLDLSNFDTQNVLGMSYMFSGCSSLTHLDLSNFDTRNVLGMSYMFEGCYSLTHLDLSNFDTRNVQLMDRMFDNCSSLTTLDLSNFDTRNVKTMGSMFYECSSLINLDLSNFDTQNVTNMSSMFYGCSSLINLDLSNFDTQNVTNMNAMFYECSSLINLGINNFDTRNVTTMVIMFGDCSSLTSLNLKNFDTRNVTNMASMFAQCSSLTNLNLNSFDTKNVTAMSWMFYNCTSLTNLDVSHFNTQNVEWNIDNIFNGCSSLTSLKISSSLGNSLNIHATNACNCVGTEDNPCAINQPEDLDFGVDTSGDYFRWQQGYFKLMESQMEQINVTTDLGCITYCSDKALNFTNVEGLKAYIVVGYNGKVAKLSRIGIVPPETGLLLKADAGEYEVPYTEEDNYVMNMLIGVLEETTLSPTEGNMTNLVLANGKNGLGFYCLKGSGTIAAHRAYLQVPTRLIGNGAKFISMEFDDDVTAISGITTQEEDAPYYDLQGVRHEGKPTKQGIYIHNGKKVVVRD